MTDQEKLNAARLLADCCDATMNCDDCVFWSSDGCKLRGSNPMDWEILDWEED